MLRSGRTGIRQQAPKPGASPVTDVPPGGLAAAPYTAPATLAGSSAAPVVFTVSPPAPAALAAPGGAELAGSPAAPHDAATPPSVPGPDGVLRDTRLSGDLTASPPSAPTAPT